jgi:hypothetical protein
MSSESSPRRPPRSRWTSFVAGPAVPGEPRVRSLHEEGNPDHRVRVEHNRDTILIHLSEEDGKGWLTLAIDRPTRACAVAAARRQQEAATKAFDELYGPRLEAQP